MIYATNHPQSIGFKPFLVLHLCCRLLHLKFYLQQIICNNLQQIDYLQQYATICNNLQQIFYKLKLISNKCHEIICNNLQQVKQSATIFSFLFQSNFTTNCHLYLPPVSSFLTLFLSKLYVSSISL